jgi:hypothetical protein
LSNHVGKTVIYEGQIAKLVRLDDNSFAVEIVDNGQEPIEEGEDLTEKTVKIIDLSYNFSQVKDGNLLLNEVGLSPVLEEEELFETDVISNEVISAKFEDSSERTAIINGVKYKVNRNNLGNIISLSYMINDQQIAEIEEQTQKLSEKNNRRRIEIGNLSQRNIILKADNEKQLNYKINYLTKLIAEDEIRIKKLNAKRLSLVNENIERTVTGGNANNMIFALNRQPNNFQRLLEGATPADQQKDLKEIARLSVSETFSKAIDEILAEQYPEALDKLLDKGVKGVNTLDLVKIQLYLEQAINRLNDLGFTVYNSKQLTDDIINQINVLRNIQNGLQLIKITKNGKISKRQPKEVEQFFSANPQEVQQRANVSQVQSPVGRQPKAVPRQATREEFQEALKKAQNIIKASQLDADIALIESEKVEAVTAETQKFIDKVNRARTEKGINKVFGQALILSNKNPEVIDIDEVSDAVDARKIALNISLELDTLTENTYLILKTKISDTDYKVGDIFRFVKTDSEDNAIIENVRDKKEYTFKQEELINTFDKKTKEALEMKTKEVPSDPETVSNNASSIDEVRKNTAAIEKAKENSDKSTRDQRISNWLKNANNC